MANIDKYVVVLYGGPGSLGGFIHCYNSAGAPVARCVFHKGVVPENSPSGTAFDLNYPMERFADVLDVLRNEGPVHANYIASSRVGFIATGEEPVGEGES